MSRIAATLSAMLLATPGVAQQPPAQGKALDRYAELVSVATNCRARPSGSEIVVCGRRAADRYRVPFIIYEAGDPRGEGVSAERNRLASEPPVKCGNGAFLINCGGVGVTATLAFGVSGTGPVRLRPLAD